MNPRWDSFIRMLSSKAKEEIQGLPNKNPTRLTGGISGLTTSVLRMLFKQLRFGVAHYIFARLLLG